MVHVPVRIVLMAVDSVVIHADDVVDDDVAGTVKVVKGVQAIEPVPDYTLEGKLASLPQTVVGMVRVVLSGALFLLVEKVASDKGVSGLVLVPAISVDLVRPVDLLRVRLRFSRF